MMPIPTDRQALRQRIDALLCQQTQAAHEGDAEQIAMLAEESLRHIREMQRRVKADLSMVGEQPAGPDATSLRWVGAEDLRRLRDIATYNQLLLRYSFTSWAARCLDRGRRCYNARGLIAEGEVGGAHGQLSKGVL